MFRTVSGQKVGDDMKVSSEQTSAVTSVQKILLAVSRLAERGHQMQFTRTGGCIVNERNGIKMPAQLKNGVHTHEGAAVETAAHRQMKKTRQQWKARAPFKHRFRFSRQRASWRRTEWRTHRTELSVRLAYEGEDAMQITSSWQLSNVK